MRLELPDADVEYLPGFLAPDEADALLAGLLREIPWQRHMLTIRGRRVLAPRLSAWYGDPGARYAYSGLILEPRAWPELLLGVRERVEAAAGSAFNSLLLNLYRDGADSMGWHSDDERELGSRPVIASLSLGAERRFRLRHRERREIAPAAVALAHGSLLLMRGDTQRCWHHALPRTARVSRPRVNGTFRLVSGA